MIVQVVPEYDGKKLFLNLKITAHMFMYLFADSNSKKRGWPVWYGFLMILDALLRQRFLWISLMMQWSELVVGNVHQPLLYVSI